MRKDIFEVLISYLSYSAPQDEARLFGVGRDRVF